MTFGGYQVASDREKARARAMSKIQKALKSGDLIRPESCELCGRRDKDRVTEETPRPWKSIIVAHHHLGYSAPLSVWFVCQSCNVVLGDRVDLNKDQARKYITLQAKYRKERKSYYKVFYIEQQRAANWRSPQIKPGQFDTWLIEQGRADLAEWATTRKPYNPAKYKKTNSNRKQAMLRRLRDT